jgi:hypothetical protein
MVKKSCLGDHGCSGEVEVAVSHGRWLRGQSLGSARTRSLSVSCVALGSYLTSAPVSFLICKMGPGVIFSLVSVKLMVNLTGGGCY